ncbi:integrase family protein [Methylocella silvestris BL2]|uniref:Integrase family protein n=1 Tax=Methylocella silvestris (strain DSM 15510 / CIP 108128 / LMG 27833 / NCIMB 13906 / BL2) TaxID=395965 RepID=B8EL00_METSB|nr:tyrosine-type recombinase/integrase [Methylocella silvestris]ACK52028.1 integrase family protein [Methylocella silvestris BL2]
MATEKAAFDTAAKRTKLPANRNPYWHGISGGRGGVSLGYRKPARGAGSWVAKIVVAGVRIEERIAPADDAGAPAGGLPYPQAVSAALSWGRQKFAGIEAREDGDFGAEVPTVQSAITAYIAEREAKSASGNDAKSRLTKHVLSDERFAKLTLARLTAASLRRWREGLPKTLRPSTVNRLLNDLRAALNAMAERHRRELPAHVAGDIKSGTKALPSATEARRQVLSDADVRGVVSAAFAVEESGDFGRLVLLVASTGARFSQIAALTVADVQVGKLRIMIPVSKKGRGAKQAARIAVPIGEDVAERLKPALNGRRGHEPLLLRWHVKQTGPFVWERTSRQPWKTASETDRLWGAAIKSAGLPAGTVMYALRHTSIVHGLSCGLPVRLVAALHDTSTAMIEKHYAAYIVDATEELARRAVMTLAPASHL